MTDDNLHYDGLLSNLLMFTGINIPARARFVVQCTASGVYSSLIVGLVAGQTGAALLSCGPVVPFMTGCWLGHSWGCLSYWRQSKMRAMNCARRYPKILAHSLLVDFDIEVPTNVHVVNNTSSCSAEEESGKVIAKAEKFDHEKTTLEQWILDGGVGRLSFAILAAQSCTEDVIELQKSERKKLVDAYSQSTEG
mmetsp:Transcript_21081/g.32411  ORF Transcript_21081/g.32411 Transcript_21081/m.32411 type:complete len:194 (+) Transcript_21081:87-668(+)